MLSKKYAVTAALALAVGATTCSPAFAADDSVPTDASKVCVLSATGGPDDCSKTKEQVLAETAKALAANEVPAGWATVPSSIKAKVSGAGAARTASAERAAAAITLSQIWEDPRSSSGSGGGFSATMGATGADYWRNFSSFWNNRSSSGYSSNSWTTYFHDLPDGGGSYYAGLTANRDIYDYGNANWQGTSTSINDRTTSWITY